MTPASREHDSLEGLIGDKVRCLGDMLTQIQQDMQRRTVLSEQVITRIYQHYCYVYTKVLELSTWQMGSNKTIESRRLRLEQQLDALKQETRQEQVQCWQDIALLRKEWRQWFKQYSDVMQRARIILPEWVVKKE